MSSDVPLENAKDERPSGEAMVGSATASRIGHLIPADAPVITAKDVLMCQENIEKMGDRNLVPYVIYLDAQFKDVVKKRKREAVTYLALKAIIISMMIILVLYIMYLCVSAIWGGT